MFPCSSQLKAGQNKNVASLHLVQLGL